MLARGLLCRLTADTPKPKTSAHNLPQLARLLQRSLVARNGLTPSAGNCLTRAYRNALVQYVRSYATAAATKKPAAKKGTATKPTSTVKKDVKKAAAAKKPVTRKKAPLAKRKPATKKSAPKKKPVAKKKKKPAAKAKPKAKRVKKALSPEEKEKLKVRELKKLCLRDEPAHVLLSARHVFNREFLKSASGTPQDALKVAFAGFKALTPAELEHYNHLANQENVTRKAAYKKWVESYTPEEIHSANLARLRLRRIHKAAGKSGRPLHTTKIKDDRIAKKPGSAYLQFYSERHASGDFKSIPITEATKLAANEWKALSASEKQPYIDAFEAAKRDRAA